MNAEERRFVVWGIKEGWSAASIGRALGVNEATVRRNRRRLATAT
jgi:IS30 family transposase